MVDKSKYYATKQAWIQRNPNYQKETRESPIGRYRMHKVNAAKRNIPWEFTFDSWWEIWEKSGHWGERGKGTTKYQMCRFNDVGPYAPDNVKIATQLENMQEMNSRRNG